MIKIFIFYYIIPILIFHQIYSVNKFVDQKEIDEKLKHLEKDIYKEATMEFNINSPQQLGFVLFEKKKSF